MGLFGKLLLVVNLIAGGGFVYLAFQNWNFRQTVAASVLWHRLVITGIPFVGEPMPTEDDAEIPFKTEISGSSAVDTVSKKFLETYFKNAGSPAAKLGGSEVVSSQVAEVARVRQKVQQLLDAAGANKGIVAGEFLEPLAETLEERDAIVKLRQQGKADELAKKLLDRFDDVLDVAKTKDETERHMKLDHLLTQLDTDVVWQKRVALIIGLRRYKTALAAQTVRFERMYNQVLRLMEQDQNSYSEAIRTLERQARLGEARIGRVGMLRMILRATVSQRPPPSLRLPALPDPLAPTTLPATTGGRGS